MPKKAKPEPGPDEKCTVCSQRLRLCRHDLPFKERMRSVNIDRSSLR